MARYERNSVPRDESFLGIRPLQSVMGISLLDAQFLLAIATACEGAVLGFYFHHVFSLAIFDAIVAAVLYFSVRSQNSNVALYAFYGYCVNVFFHVVAVTKCGLQTLIFDDYGLKHYGHEGILFFVLVPLTLFSFLGLIVSYSYYARLHQNQVSVVMGEEKAEPLMTSS